MTEAAFRTETGVGVNIRPPVAREFQVDCYPNPFSHSVNIRYSLPAGVNVRIDILSLDGRILTNLHSGFQPEGTHLANWQAEDHPNGFYFYRIMFNNSVYTGKLILHR